MWGCKRNKIEKIEKQQQTGNDLFVGEQNIFIQECLSKKSCAKKKITEGDKTSVFWLIIS